MAASMITGIVKKHVYTANGFDIFSVQPLVNDPENPVTVDKKWHTLTIKGGNINHLKEGHVYTMNVNKLRDTAKYKDAYEPELVLTAYPNVPSMQIEFINELTHLFIKTDTRARNKWDKFLKDVNLEEMSKDEIEQALEDGTLNMDIVKDYKTYLYDNDAMGPVYRAIDPLSPFSPVVQYLTDKCGVVQADALALANSKTVQLKAFKDNAENVFALYHDGDSMPIDALMRVQYQVNSTPDLTPQNAHFLDSAIRYYVEQNLYKTNNDYTNKATLIQQLNDTFPIAYDWEIILKAYQPQRKSKFKVVMIDDEPYFVPNKVYYSTRTIIRFFRNSMEKRIEYGIDLDNLAGKFNLDFEPSSEQKSFIKSALTSKITLLTGPAGTGKSGTIAALTKILEADKQRFTLLAPTAKAAQQLTEYSRYPARTVHSWVASTKNADPTDIEERFIVIDEMSMMDEELCAQTLKLIESINETRAPGQFIHLIWAGDVAQLLPVGFGAPFRDALNLYPELTTRLTKIYRQSNPDLIDVLQTAREGKFQVENIFTTRAWTPVTPKVAYKYYDGPEQVAELISRNMPEYTPSAFDAFGIISPTNNNVTQINIALQNKLNPAIDGRYVTRTLLSGQNERFSIGDPIVLTKNASYISVDKTKDMLGAYGDEALEEVHIMALENRHTTARGSLKLPERYLKHYVNGDYGYVTQVITPKAFVISVKTPKGMEEILMHVDHLTYSNLELAYAITVHKSQGSQFQHVIFVNSRSLDSMSGKNLIYTALSRAKEDVVIFSNSLFSNINESRDTLWPMLFAHNDLYTKM